MTLHPLSNYGLTTLKGKIRIRLLNFDEEYIFNPIANVSVKGLFFGTSIMENLGTSEVYCEKTGFKCIFKWKTDRVISGTISQKNEKIYKINGNYCDSITLKNIKKKKTFPFYSIKSMVESKKIVEDINKQEKNESRVVWLEVAKLLDSKKYDEAKVQYEGSLGDKSHSTPPSASTWFINMDAIGIAGV